MSDLTQPLDLGPDADVETLRAALHDREVQLRDAVALGNQLYEERQELERQVDGSAERESQLATTHRREQGILNDQLHAALTDREALTARVEELAAESKENLALANKYRGELERAASTNEALRADVEHHERLEESIRMQESSTIAPEEDAALKVRVQELERELTAVKASATSLQLQRENERATAQAQAADLREKLASANSDLERAKRDSAAERARLQAAVRDAQTAGANPTSSPTQRRSMGPTRAPEAPKIQFDQQGGGSDAKLDREYEAFSARARSASSAHFVVGRDRGSQQQLQAPPAAVAERRPSRRRLVESDSDGEEMAEPVTVSASSASAAETSSPRSRRATVAEAQPYRPHQGTCPTCGRSDADSRQVAVQEEKKGGCPCVVM